VKKKIPSPSIGHQALNLPSPSFFLSLKGGLGSLELSSSLDTIFNSIWRIFVSVNFLRRRRMVNFGSGGKEGK
jgi:hypothetical protein